MAVPGKKVGRPKGRPRTGTGDAGRVTVAVYKGGAEYAEWVRAASVKSRLPVTTMLDVALAVWANANGIDPPPPRLADGGGAGEGEG